MKLLSVFFKIRKARAETTRSESMKYVTIGDELFNNYRLEEAAGEYQKAI